MRRRTVDAWLVTAILVSALPVRLAAQAPTSNTDGVIAPAIAPGNPASSYALSGLDHVNEYNGNLNVRIPLYQVGGRGTAGYTMLLPIDRSWGVQQTSDGTNYALGWQGTPDFNPPSYSPGSLYVRHETASDRFCRLREI